MTRAPASAPHVITLTGTDDGGEAQTVFFARMDTRRSIPVFEDDARRAATFGSKREADHVIARLRDFWKREMAGKVPAFKARAIGGTEFDRAENPVPASKHAGNARPSRSRIGKAADLYRRFTGNEPHKAARLVDESARGDAFLRVGAVDGILYTTNREGKAEKYIHHFRPESRPELLVTHDGKVARTLGGRFTFTERGFVDEDAAGNAVE